MKLNTVGANNLKSFKGLTGKERLKEKDTEDIFTGKDEFVRSSIEEKPDFMNLKNNMLKKSNASSKSEEAEFPEQSERGFGAIKTFGAILGFGITSKLLFNFYGAVPISSISPGVGAALIGGLILGTVGGAKIMEMGARNISKGRAKIMEMGPGNISKSAENVGFKSQIAGAGDGA